MKKVITEEQLKKSLYELDLAPQTIKDLKRAEIGTVSDFLLYDCQENTKYTSYGIISLKIGKNGRKRLYRELEKIAVPRSYERNEVNSFKPQNEIFDLRLKVGVINKLYRCEMKNFLDLCRLSTFDKKCLGNDYNEVYDFVQQQGFKVLHEPFNYRTKIINFLLPQKLNVIKKGEIDKKSLNFDKEFEQWAIELRNQGFENFIDVKKYGYQKFAIDYGNMLEPYLEEYDVKMPGFNKQKKLDDLKEMRSLVKMLIDVHADEFSKDQSNDVLAFVKKRINKF